MARLFTCSSRSDSYTSSSICSCGSSYASDAYRSAMNHGPLRHVQKTQSWARKALRPFRSPLQLPTRLNSRRSSTSPRCKVVFSGIQPTGVPHLGNYLGALQQWTALQDEAPSSTDLIFSIVDLHAITVQQNTKHLRQWKRETLAALLAIGLDPERCTLFYQSAV